MTSERVAALALELEREGAETGWFLAALPPEADGVAVYADGAAWTVRDVLAHLVTIEPTMRWLFRAMKGGGEGSPSGFDIERFNRTQPAKLAHLSRAELLARRADIRRAMIADVLAMDDADLDRTGRHAALGETTLERMVDWAHQHARLHLADVHRALHEQGQLQLRTVYGEVALGHCHPMLQQELALLSGADPFASHRQAPERLAARIDGLDAAALGWRPAPGEWSVVEVLAHLVQTEIVYGYRYRATVAEPGGPLAGYDQEAWVARLSQPDLAAADLLEQLRALKAINVAFLERLAPEQRALWGLHGERGRESVAALIGAMAGHDVLHERQIEANIRAWRAREGG